MARPPLRCFLNAEDLLTEMDYFGINEALIAHAGTSIRMQYMHDVNHQLANWVDEGEGRLHACWVWPVTQRATAPHPLAAVKAMVEQGVKAVRLLPDRSHPNLVDSWVCGGTLGALEAHRIPVFLERTDLASTWGLDYGIDVPRRGFSVESIHTICQNHPSLPIVAMWLGGHPDVVLPLLESCPNLHLDFPCLPDHKHFDLYLQVADAERLLYGSGLPRSSPAKALAIVNYSRVSRCERSLILGDNLRRLLSEVRDGS
jgi:predicted TIM-barrel fold metal-dependent hydrolase